MTLEEIIKEMSIYKDLQINESMDGFIYWTYEEHTVCCCEYAIKEFRAVDRVTPNGNRFSSLKYDFIYEGQKRCPMEELDADTLNDWIKNILMGIKKIAVSERTAKIEKDFK